MDHKYYLIYHKVLWKSIQSSAGSFIDKKPIVPSKIKLTTTNIVPGLKWSKIIPLQMRYTIYFVSKPVEKKPHVQQQIKSTREN